MVTSPTAALPPRLLVDHVAVRRRVASLVLAIALLGASCGQRSDATQGPGSFESGWFDITPNTAREGQTIAVSYLRPTTRGIDFDLYDRFRREWRLRYVIIVDRVAAQLPKGAAMADATRLPKNFAIPDSLFSGAEPDQVTLPKALATGDYLLCTRVSPPASPPASRISLRTACTALRVEGRPIDLAPRPR